jgi:hypothetical protein
MSPTIYREKGFRFFFFLNEESRMHVHVICGDGEAKYWLEPEIALAKNHHLKQKQLSEIERIVEAHSDEFIDAWKRVFGS